MTITGKKVKWCRDNLAPLQEGTIIDKLLIAHSLYDVSVTGYLIIDDDNNLHVVDARKLRSIVKKPMDF